MNKIFFLALFICASAFAGSFTSASFTNLDNNAENNAIYISEPKNQVYRSSFFMTFDIGPVFVFSSDMDGELSSNIARDVGYYLNWPSKGSYNGNGLGAQAKLGILFKQYVAAYVIVGAFESSGNYEVEVPDTTFTKKRKYEFNDATSSHFYGGLGTIIYPFRDDEGFINGIYLGFDLGLNIGGISYDDYDGAGSVSSHLQLEIGKEFDVSKRWKLGVGLTGSRMSHFDGGEYTEYSLQLNFHVTRR